MEIGESQKELNYKILAKLNTKIVCPAKKALNKPSQDPVSHL